MPKLILESGAIPNQINKEAARKVVEASIRVGIRGVQKPNYSLVCKV